MLTAKEERATEVRLVPQKDGHLVVVYLRDAGPAGAELVTAELACKVTK